VQSPLANGYDDLHRLNQATNQQVAAPEETVVFHPVGSRPGRDGEAIDAALAA
jgi:hypothetical protein